MTTPLIETIARAMLTVDYAESEQKHPGITAEALDDDYALEGYIAQAQAAITALTEAGYAIVPVEANHDMMVAGEPLSVFTHGDGKDDHILRRLNAAAIYRAMIEAGRVRHNG